MSGFCVIAGEQRLLPPTPLTMHHWVVLGASQVRYICGKISRKIILWENLVEDIFAGNFVGKYFS